MASAPPASRARTARPPAVDTSTTPAAPREHAALALLRRHPVLTFYGVAFAIAWGGMLLVIGGPGAFPSSNAQQVERRFPMLMLTWFAGPSLASILLTGLPDGRAGDGAVAEVARLPAQRCHHQR